ncbi:MAG: DUF2970 domain-containing protein [Luminiphilus sp.]
MRNDRHADPEPADPPPVPELPSAGLSWLQVIRSALAAGLGVQSRAHRERDFEQGSAGRFVAAGLVLTVLLVATLFVIVRMALP